MGLATIIIAALLGSAWVARAGRKCVVCGPLATDERGKWANCKTDISKYMRLDVAAQKLLGLSIQGRYLRL